MKSHINSLFNSMSYRFGSILLDPGDEWEGFFDVGAVLLTHAHCDHIYGLNRVIDLNPNVRIYTNEPGREMLLNARKNLSHYYESPIVCKDPARIQIVKDREKFELDDHLITKAIYTPGHNPSCITWIMGNYIFTGDSYIPGIPTVTNLPGGDKVLSRNSYHIILKLSQNKMVLPGHSIDNNSK